MAQIRSARSTRPTRPTRGLTPPLLLLPLLVTVTMMMMMIASPAEARRRPACRDRPESFLRRELHSCRGSRHRLLLNEGLVEQLSGREARDAPSSGGNFGRTGGRNGTRKRCPLWNELVASTELEARALAPWTIKVDYDVNRYPSRIAMAECLCAGCVEPRPGTFDSGLVSVPVVYRMRALYRRACNSASGLFSYERRWVDVPLACTCAVAKTAREPPGP